MGKDVWITEGQESSLKNDTRLWKEGTNAQLCEYFGDAFSFICINQEQKVDNFKGNPNNPSLAIRQMYVRDIQKLSK